MTTTVAVMTYPCDICRTPIRPGDIVVFGAKLNRYCTDCDQEYNRD